jgi:hypothetical protein
MEKLFEDVPALALATMLLACATAVFLFLVNLLFAFGVMNDAERIRSKGEEVAFVGPGTWALGVLVGSFLVVALYWLVHHSTLRAPPRPAQASASS